MKTIREHKFITACIVLALLITAVTLTSLLRTDEADRKKRAESIEEAVRERVIQCYVIENAYPESLSYLEEYYGLPHSGHPTFGTPDGDFHVVADTRSSEWDAIVASPDWQVTLDLYSCGVAVSSPRLSKQHFLLR